jgi:O-antigen/teichoic acid export membrane protein
MLLERFKKSEFVRNLVALTTGTAIAQVLPLALSPILTRIYTPEEFGIFALYISLLSIFGVIATARYELAIVQPVEDKDALSIAVLSLVVTSCLSLVVFIIVLFFNSDICKILGVEGIASWLYVLPVSIFIVGCYQTLSYLLVRKKEFKGIAIAGVLQSATGGGGQVLLGWGKQSGGLILGNMIGAFASLLALSVVVFKYLKKDFDEVNINRVRENALKYSDFPKYSLIGAFSNSAAQQAPVFFLSRVFDSTVVGLYSVVIRVVSAPVSLVSSGLSQVIFERISFYRKTDPKKIRWFLLKIFLILLLIMLPFIVLTNMFGEFVFVFIFGDPWRYAGELAGILVFSVAIRFAVSPLSVVLSLEGNVFLGMMWQVMYFLSVCIALYFLSEFELKLFLIGFVIHDVVLYFIYFLFIMKGSNRLCISSNADTP